MCSDCSDLIVLVIEDVRLARVYSQKSASVNYLFRKLESWGWCRFMNPQEGDFCLDSILMQLHMHTDIPLVCFYLFIYLFLWFLMETLQLWWNTKLAPFHSPTQHVSVSLNLWTFFHNFPFTSSLLSPSSIKPSLFLRYLAIVLRQSSKSLSSTTPVVKCITLAFEVSLKKKK